MKIFDKYILKSFIQPLLATFFVVLFVLVMQALWLAFDEIAGKGIDLVFILKFLGYLALMLTPTALPIGILLSSIMALGNLAENYEFAAMKSAGISLKRVIRPLVILTLFLSGLNFVFLNNIYPWATLKQKNLYLNMKMKKPALALVPGAFNTDIPGFSIKFEEKYGEDKNLLKNVQIADLNGGKGKIKVITAAKGTISSDEGSKYMTLTLEDGNYYEEHVKRMMLQKDREKMPASNATFEKYTINIDVSSFNDSESLKDEKVKEHHGMLSVHQLDSISKIKKISYDEYIGNRAKSFYSNVKGNKLYKYPDSLINKDLAPEILENFNLNNQNIVINDALQTVKRYYERSNNEIKMFKDQRKLLNLYDYEFNYRFSFSLACLVLFFIGAPLGSIIRKGGFGLPMLLAIFIFVIYFFISQFSKNLAEESAISAIIGSWMSTLILLPFGILLTYKATKGMGIFNIDAVIDNFKKFFGKFTKKINLNNEQ
ncbi:YjgP/YjgQ family permease [Lutibacter sp. HS1-25]|uniref:LptF/LptG family permease n=1 Tax=Lutibacter sp. HS1-25 TaxID=2485000 RepID=UPI001012D0B5|nr:LptF/LptG family permease [Lutibacter sp. HS1-25]RXP55763.1 YjgP/YjgQ family permease [Lutibacter sp. HS1-25]